MATYTLNISMGFPAAHSLRGYEGKCARIHGHNYRVMAEIQTEKLNEIGLAVDYFDVKQVMRPIIEQIDHYYINEVRPFDTINPTAENIAKWFYGKLKTGLASTAATTAADLQAITLWEGENFSVRYCED